MDSRSKLRFTMLGCGSSPGTPRINGDWGNCDPENPKNKRMRCSLLVERIGPNGTTTVVVDTGPDFRLQMLSADVTSLDGVLYTHSHADHIHGIDDLRGYALTKREKINVYADKPTSERLLESFAYCFKSPEGSMYPPILRMNPIIAGELVTIEGEGGPIHALPVLQTHGAIVSLGFRFGRFEGNNTPLPGGFGYSPDVSDIPDDQIDGFRNLDVWVLDALQYKPHISHFSLDQALKWVEQLQPKRAILTHMHTPLDYETVLQETPDHVEPGYDGLVVELPDLK